jgi:hypothetical protein
VALAARFLFWAKYRQPRKDMALTKFDLISQAFIKLDAETVASFDDGTREAEIAATLYDNAKESERSSYPWNFTQKTFQLSQIRFGLT